MFGLHTTNEWLAISIKNRHFFSTDQVVNSVAYIPAISEAYKDLRNALPSAKTREDYVSWRSTWRGLYSKMSDESRFAKENRKSTNVGHAISGANIANIESLRQLSHSMLALRLVSKEWAASQYVPKVKAEA